MRATASSTCAAPQVNGLRGSGAFVCRQRGQHITPDGRHDPPRCGAQCPGRWCSWRLPQSFGWRGRHFPSDSAIWRMSPTRRPPHARWRSNNRLQRRTTMKRFISTAVLVTGLCPGAAAPAGVIIIIGGLKLPWAAPTPAWPPPDRCCRASPRAGSRSRRRWRGAAPTAPWSRASPTERLFPASPMVASSRKSSRAGPTS